MIILTLNPGSTSVKISLFKDGEKLFHEDIVGTLDDIEQKIKDEGYNFAKIDKFAIRVVHGGSFFTEPTKITDESLAKLREISELAPLHNPPAIKIIEEILAKKSDADIWAIFDTAFHSTIPEHLSLYAIPLKISRDFGIKKFGFHGTANQSAIHLVENKTGAPVPAKTIICHLGGGASVTAVKNGKSIGNSMGFTPLEGLMMVTRAGDLDDGVIEFLMHKMDLPIEEVMEIENKKSGILGITGSKNLVEVFANHAKLPEYELAFQMYLSRVEKYVWSYIGRLGGLDCLIFSGGTGEHNAKIREKICEKLGIFGFELDLEINNFDDPALVDDLSTKKSAKKIYAVHDEEDREMVRQIQEN